MSTIKQQLLVIAVVVGLLLLLVVERAFGLPLLFVFLSLLVMNQSSAALQAVLTVLLGLFLAVLYLLPLWLGVLLLAVGFLAQERLQTVFPLNQIRIFGATVAVVASIFFISNVALSFNLVSFLLLDIVVFIIFFYGMKFLRRSKDFYITKRK